MAVCRGSMCVVCLARCHEMDMGLEIVIIHQQRAVPSGLPSVATKPWVPRYSAGVVTIGESPGVRHEYCQWPKLALLLVFYMLTYIRFSRHAQRPLALPRLESPTRGKLQVEYGFLPHQRLSTRGSQIHIKPIWHRSSRCPHYRSKTTYWRYCGIFGAEMAHVVR